MTQSRFFHQSVIDKYGAAFAVAVAFVLDRETEFNRDGTVHCEHDPNDPGGTTMYGIDAGSHPGVDVVHLTEAQADAIYHGTEWKKIQGDRLPSFLALPMLDTAVNPGWKPACVYLQEAVGVNPDGAVSSVTVGALGKLDGRGLLRVALAVQDKREAYYRARPDYLHGKPFGKAFLPGWLNRVNLIRAVINTAARNLEPSDCLKLLQICYGSEHAKRPVGG